MACDWLPCVAAWLGATKFVDPRDGAVNRDGPVTRELVAGPVTRGLTEGPVIRGLTVDPLTRGFTPDPVTRGLAPT